MDGQNGRLFRLKNKSFFILSFTYSIICITFNSVNDARGEHPMNEIPVNCVTPFPSAPVLTPQVSPPVSSSPVGELTSTQPLSNRDRLARLQEQIMSKTFLSALGFLLFVGCAVAFVMLAGTAIESAKAVML